MEVVLVKGPDAYAITNLISNKRWEGQKDKSMRTLSFSFLKTLELDIDLGDEVIFYGENNAELYRGRVFSRNLNLLNQREIKTFDQMFYMVKNKDSFTFEKLTAEGILQQIAKQFQLPLGEVASTGYKIPSLVVSNRDLYSIMIEALSETFKQTGDRYYLRSMGGKIHLIKRVEKLHNWVIETGSNLITASMSESAENLATQVKLFSKEKKKVITVIEKNSDLIAKFGVLQHSESQSGKLNAAQLKERAIAQLKEKSVVAKTTSVEALGIEDVISGDCVYINIPAFGLAKAFYIDKDVHTFTGNVHKMNLQLTETL